MCEFQLQGILHCQHGHNARSCSARCVKLSDNLSSLALCCNFPLPQWWRAPSKVCGLGLNMKPVSASREADAMTEESCICE